MRSLSPGWPRAPGSRRCAARRSLTRNGSGRALISAIDDTLLLGILSAPPNVSTAIALSNRRLGIEGRPGRPLAPFACHAERSRGRAHAEPDDPLRSPFQRDRDRIVHSTAFRRLEHKTQVFVSHEGDHFRTRLTHTLEVAQIARTAARALALDEDLAEAVALADDLGHSPFGHAGEERWMRRWRQHGGFDHNAQTRRVVTRLERRYAEFDGLNLTWETLEGVVKHNGPLRRRVPRFVAEYCAGHDLELATHRQR